MDDFFSELGRKLSETADIVGKKTNEIWDTEKLRSQIRSLERANERDYMDIGKSVYENFQNHEVTDESCIEFCEAIEKRQEKIEDLKKEIGRIKGE